ncbi:hypothetical protein PAHAL_3G451500 [Panicum hallii]|uniref:BHLH domain-containing protein n=1 Tax=Panicum hallii TaxID=206008 RepID=A0A2S3HEA9_9POAL|nr:uncharacterized protein LOC112886855 [Panicum hallii]PAN21231.1 hypothetical protein PAHAL_3G451500 [Panicum hallii]
MATAAAAGGLPLELSLDTVAAPAAATTAESAVERRRRRDREVQRRRRARVSALYAELGAMLPSLPTSRPATQEKIVDAAKARVEALEDTAAALQACRGAPRPGREVALSCGTVTVSARLPSPKPAGALRRVVEAFERRGARVLMATMARHGGAVVVTVTAAAAALEVVEMIRADIASIN